MEFVCKTTGFNQHKSDCAVVFIGANKTLSPFASAVDLASNGAVGRIIGTGDLEAEAGSKAWFHPANTKMPRVLLVATGQKADHLITNDQLRKIADATAKALCHKGIKQAVVHCDGLENTEVTDEQLAQLLCIDIATNLYRYTHTKPGHDRLPELRKVTLAFSDDTKTKAFETGCASGSAIASGINLARELGNLPANICTPSYLAEQAKGLAKSCPALTTQIIDAAEMKKLGMGSLLSVAQGSAQPPKLIILEYKGKSSKAPHVIVGKGITFDTGGISLKPGLAMDEMKFDMCGAASVLGTMQALIALNAPVHVVGVVAAAENMPGEQATKPGDVVTSMSGRTIEILNTDAEGRLVLCDALTYVERFKPKSVVDIATLTGACVIALGNHASGLFANNQELADKLLAAGIATHDRAWQMPLWDEYKKSLKSNFADLANIGAREGGSITAACFLAHFTESYPWAHLDIAGTAWLSGKHKGATGRPVALLVHYLLNAS
jgi:leucyl aminopeptidase